MLEAYERHPAAFTSSVDERAAQSLAWWERRLEVSERATDVVFGARSQEGLKGAAGISFCTGEKVRHKAAIFGMYVALGSRGAGLAEALLQATLAHARSRREISVVQLSVTKGNEAAEQLYLRAGFESFADEPMAVRVGADYVNKRHMWRRI